MAGEPQGLASPRGPEGHGLVWLLLLSLSLFIVLLPISSYIAALSFIKSELGLNNAGAGALFSAYLAGYAASALYLVPLTDRLGPKRIIYVSAALSVAAHLLFPLMTYNVVAGAALRAIAGVGFLGIYIPGLRLVARRFEQSGRGSAMGLFVTAQYAAHSGSLALTGWLMATMEWRDAYALVAAVSAVSLPLMFFLVRSVPDTRRPLTGGRLDPTVLKNRPVQFVILGYTVHALNLYALRVWLPIFLASVLIAKGVAGREGRGHGGGGGRPGPRVRRYGSRHGRINLRPARTDDGGLAYPGTVGPVRGRFGVDRTLALGADRRCERRLRMGGIGRLRDLPDGHHGGGRSETPWARRWRSRPRWAFSAA